MAAVRDGWTPLLRQIKSSVSSNARRRLLGKLIGDVLRQTKQNFGPTGVDRPEPWSFLTPDYSKRVKRPYATLDLKTPKGKFNKGQFEKLKTAFLTTVTENSASLTNTAPHADYHQLGEGNNPRRAFYPVYLDDRLTAMQESRLEQIVREHFTDGQEI